MDSEALDRLVVEVQKGRREAFREVFSATHQDLRLHLSAHGAGAEQVDEALQAAYVAAYERLAQYRPTGTFRAWLKTIARHQLIDRWRERRRQAELEGTALDELVAVAAIDRLEDEEDAKAAEARTAQLGHCLQQLPEHARILIETRYRDNLSLDDLARRFKRTANALAVALHRIRSGLKRCIEEAS